MAPCGIGGGRWRPEYLALPVPRVPGTHRLRARKWKNPDAMTTKPKCDPTKILEQIAADKDAPATARVQAAKALIAIRKAASKKDEAPADAVTQRALRLLNGGKQ